MQLNICSMIKEGFHRSEEKYIIYTQMNSKWIQCFHVKKWNCDFLSKMHNLNLIKVKHQTNPDGGPSATWLAWNLTAVSSQAGRGWKMSSQQLTWLSFPAREGKIGTHPPWECWGTRSWPVPPPSWGWRSHWQTWGSPILCGIWCHNLGKTFPLSRSNLVQAESPGPWSTRSLRNRIVGRAQPLKPSLAGGKFWRKALFLIPLVSQFNAYFHPS